MTTNKKNIDIARDVFQKEVTDKSWPIEFVESCEPLFLDDRIFGDHPFELEHPGFLYLKKTKHVLVLRICGSNFFPIGHCGNGDWIVVAARPESGANVGEVCFISHALYPIYQSTGGYLRVVSPDLSGFLLNISSMPCDGYEPSPFSPRLVYHGKKKKKAEKEDRGEL